VQHTGDIGLFKIQSEGAVAAGVRRIEAISSEGAFNFMRNELNLLDEVRQTLKSKDILKSIQDLQLKNADLQKQIDKFTKEKSAGIKDELKEKITSVNGVNFLAERVDLDPAALKDVAFQLKAENEKFFAIFTGESGGKAMITCAISEDLVKEKNLNASNIIRELAKEINGGGGGQAFFATAGGTNANGLPIVIEKAKSYIL
jgi:alanyl-tRNA synthetase